MNFKRNIEVYLCGPMSGLKNYNMLAFKDATACLRDRGIKVQSPVELNTDSDGKFPCRQWEEAMRIDISVMCMCDAVVLLLGWENSQGAALEHFIAVRLGILVVRYSLPEVFLDLAHIPIQRVK